MTTKCTLVLGGAASGKSAFAEKLVIDSQRPRIYLATAQVWDDEMQSKVADHVKARGPDWTTVEAKTDLAPALAAAPAESIVLLDCATMWLTNVMMAEQEVAPATRALLDALANCPAPVIIVSNELGQGIVPADPFTRRFRDAHGKMNQALAAQADRVVAVMAGLPMVLKGDWP